MTQGGPELGTPEDRISHRIIGGLIRVHSALGPGLLESAYEACVAYDLRLEGLKLETQVPLPVIYRGMKVDCGFRIDMIVEALVIVEFKAVERLLPIHEAQALTYLKLTGKRLCILVNFNVERVRDGIQRVVLNL